MKHLQTGRKTLYRALVYFQGWFVYPIIIVNIMRAMNGGMEKNRREKGIETCILYIVASIVCQGISCQRMPLKAIFGK